MFCYFYSPWGSTLTLLTAGSLTNPQLPATASNVCATNAWLDGVSRVPPPPTIILATPAGSIHNNAPGLGSEPRATVSSPSFLHTSEMVWPYHLSRLFLSKVVVGSIWLLLRCLHSWCGLSWSCVRGLAHLSILIS